MSMPDESRSTAKPQSRIYEIRVRGPIGPTMREAFPTLVVSRRGQDTVLTGPVPDQAALYGVLHQIEALGLELIMCAPVDWPATEPSDDVQPSTSAATQ